MPGSDIIRKVIETARQRGFVTFDELNELLPPATTSSEDIEAVLAALSDEGINVIENEEP